MIPPRAAWAAVAPDGTIDSLRVYPTEDMAKAMASCHWAEKNHASALWDNAHAAGWRVVPVRIEVVEDGK